MKKHLILLLFITFFSTFGQQKLIDELKQLSNKDAFKAIIFGDSILQNANLSEFDKGLVRHYQAVSYRNNRNYKKALHYFNEAVPALEKNKNKRRYVVAILGQSDCNVYLNNHSIAITQALKAKEIAQKNNLNDLVASANTGLSFIYYSNQDFLKALEFIMGSEHIFIKENKYIELSAIYNNMAIIYKALGQFDKSILYNNKSLDLSVKNKDYLGIAESYNNIGSFYEQTGEYNQAIIFYNKAINTNTTYHLSNSQPYRNFARVLLGLKKYKLAEEHLNKALKIELKNQTENAILKIYKDLLRVAIQTESYKKAYEYQQKIEKVSEKISHHNSEEKIKMIENQYLLTQQQQELIHTKQKIKNQFILFIAITFVLFFFMLFLFQHNKNTKLKTEKEKIVLEQRILRSQMNPHFIFNALSAIQNTLLDDEPIQSAFYLSRFAKLIRQNFDFINEKSILLADEIDALQNYLDTQKMRFHDKFDYEINIYANVDVNTVQIPPLLIQPFIENAIEHGFKNKKDLGKITINILMKGHRICYEIKDNGKGFNPTIHKKGTHAIDIFKKRLKLLDKGDEKSFKIKTSDKGTQINFCLKQ